MTCIPEQLEKDIKSACQKYRTRQSRRPSSSDWTVSWVWCRPYITDLLELVGLEDIEPCPEVVTVNVHGVEIDLTLRIEDKKRIEKHLIKDKIGFYMPEYARLLDQYLRELGDKYPCVGSGPRSQVATYEQPFRVDIPLPCAEVLLYLLVSYDAAAIVSTMTYR
jgi:hypothetical protein